MRRLLPASRSWYPFVVSVILTACGGGGDKGGGGTTPPPPSNTPTAITAVSSATGQEATVGTAVANPPAVRVTNSAGAGLQGIAVTFAVTAGGGSLATTTAQTNAQGIATAGAWTLGTTAGTNTVTATSGTLTTTLTATGRAGAAATIAGVNTTGLTGSAGSALAAPVTVRVTDASNNPIAGASVTFTPTSGSGSVSASPVATNASGEAQTTWTLGADAGTDQLVAAVAGTSVTTTISATATITPLVASRVDVGTRAFKCVVRASGVVSCFGENPAGNLGDGTQTFRERPVDVNLTGVSFSTVALGALHGCALSTGGAPYCWGRNNTGVVGDNTTTDRLSPVGVGGGHTFASLAVGSSYSCGLKADGTVWCWGQQNGGAAATQRTAPTALTMGASRVSAIAVTNTQVCGAITTGGTLCWTGDIFASAPAPANTGLTFTALAGGGSHLCGLVADGRAFCWGFNAAGQLGTNDINDRAAPTQVVGSFRYSAIDAGENHTCAIGTDGASYCWGNNISGQLGVNVLPTVEPARAYPSAVAAPSGVQFQRIAAGGNASCGIAANAQVYCWGARAFDNAGQFVSADPAPVLVRDK